MKGVLYVSHGSRVREATQEAIEFINLVIEQVEVRHQEICFLELSEPDVKEGARTLIERGVTEVSVIPVLLLSAGHYFKDIPEEIEQVKKEFPHVSFSYGEPLGVQPRITNILKERISETGVSPLEDAKLLVVGRGSFHKQTQIDISNIGNALGEITEFQSVEVCYLAASQPSFEETLKTALEEKHSQIFIVPYLWFTGILEKHIETTVDQSEFHGDIILCGHLGDHPAMQIALKERVYETFERTPDLEHC